MYSVSKYVFYCCSLGSEKVGQSVASASTGAALVCLDDLRKSALYNGSTGRRETIDFEQWPEQSKS